MKELYHRADIQCMSGGPECRNSTWRQHVLHSSRPAWPFEKVDRKNAQVRPFLQRPHPSSREQTRLPAKPVVSALELETKNDLVNFKCFKL